MGIGCKVKIFNYSHFILTVKEKENLGFIQEFS